MNVRWREFLEPPNYVVAFAFNSRSHLSPNHPLSYSRTEKMMSYSHFTLSLRHCGYFDVAVPLIHQNSHHQVFELSFFVKPIASCDLVAPRI